MATTPKKRSAPSTTKTLKKPVAAKGTTVTKPAATESEAAKSATKTAKPAAAKPVAAKAAAKPRAPAKTRVVPAAKAKPKTTVRAKAKAKVAPIIEVLPTAKQAAVIAAGTGGVLAAVGAAFFLWRASKADQPEYRLVERDGDFEIREYPALVFASTEMHGPRKEALDRGFRVLADYIFAKSRSGKKIAMTAPVLCDGADKGGWRTRFIMPAGTVRSDLPAAPAGVILENQSPRRMAAVRFSGRADDAILNTREGALRSWLQLRSLPCEAKAEHAFYNAPVTPGPLRRNEVLVPLSSM